MTGPLRVGSGPRSGAGSHAAQVDAPERDVPPEPERRLVLVRDAEAVPLEQDREVGRLLELDDEHAVADRVRRARGHEDRVARLHGQRVERAEHRVVVLLADPALERLGRDVLAEAGRDARVGLRRGDDDPRLGLAVPGAQRAAGEGVVRVDVDGQPLAGVEQLDEQRRVGAAAGRVVRAEERDRVGGRGVAQQACRRAGG